MALLFAWLIARKQRNYRSKNIFVTLQPFIALPTRKPKEPQGDVSWLLLSLWFLPDPALVE